MKDRFQGFFPESTKMGGGMGCLCNVVRGRDKGIRLWTDANDKIVEIITANQINERKISFVLFDFGELVRQMGGVFTTCKLLIYQIYAVQAKGECKRRWCRCCTVWNRTHSVINPL